MPILICAPSPDSAPAQERTLLFACGGVEEGAVLRHDLVEQPRLGKDALEVGQSAPGHEDQLAAGVLQPMQGDERLFLDFAVVGKCSVIVRCQRDEEHVLLSTWPS